MPRIQINDINGQAYAIDSSDRDTIARWLGETISLLGPGAARYSIPLQIQIWPRFLADGQPDWYTDSVVASSRYALNVAGLKAFLDDLRKAGVDVPETTGAVA